MKIIQLNKDHAAQIASTLTTAFNSNYSENDVIDTFEKYEYYGIVLNDKLEALTALYYTDKISERQNEELIKNSKNDNIVFISQLASLKKGLGRQLLQFAINKFKNKPIDLFLTARNLKLVKYYESFGFIRVKTKNPRFKLMRYEG